MSPAVLGKVRRWQTQVWLSVGSVMDDNEDGCWELGRELYLTMIDFMTGYFHLGGKLVLFLGLTSYFFFL